MTLKNHFPKNRIRMALLGTMTFLLGIVFLTGNVHAQETPESGDSAAVSAESEEKSATNFMDDMNEKLEKVDKYVGEKIVAPMEGVIFNGLWTKTYKEKKVDEAGLPILDPETGEQVIIEHIGWLGDGSVSVPFIVVWLFVGAVFFTLFMGCLLYTSPSPRD